MLIITVVWILIMGESYLLFFVIRPTGPNIHGSVSSALLKISSTIVLGVIWVAVMFALENFLFRRTPVGGSKKSSGTAGRRQTPEKSQ
jgi:hypothetical protein